MWDSSNISPTPVVKSCGSIIFQFPSSDYLDQVCSGAAGKQVLLDQTNHLCLSYSYLVLKH
ncbi:hypothetical protein EXN66_Car015308 [Channa argus]|uniref:Uncharacterized protein n=1 Tax=Channa argus TaxID=215402 RepID=A0A6G1QAF7_CHAAH|nr:hypothetical protein EXN66_Car015308 [Channa argus]